MKLLIVFVLFGTGKYCSAICFGESVYPNFFEFRNKVSRVFVYSPGAGNFIVIYADAEAVTVVGGRPSSDSFLGSRLFPSVPFSNSLVCL